MRFSPLFVTVKKTVKIFNFYQCSLVSVLNQEEILFNIVLNSVRLHQESRHQVLCGDYIFRGGERGRCYAELRNTLIFVLLGLAGLVSGVLKGSA